MAVAWYCTREDVKRALDIKTSAYANDRVDRAIGAASEAVEGQMRRTFYPLTTTHTFDWLPHQFDLTWRVWLDQRELCMAPTQVLSSGTDITANILARPDPGPPYDRLEVDLSSSSMWSSGSTYQRAISVTGTFGYQYNTASAGTLTAAVSDTTGTSIMVSDSSLIGIGSLLVIGTERMIVTAKSLVSAGTTLSANIDAQARTTGVAVADGTAIASGEVITVDSERMLVVDIAGNTLIVERGFDGSVLAAHTSGATVYVPSTLAVTRGALGSTAATHLDGAAIGVFVYPSLITQLTIAEAVTSLIQERAGYARAVGSDASNVIETIGKGLSDLRLRAYTKHGRKVVLRTAARFI